jgi:hypothetical protein
METILYESIFKIGVNRLSAGNKLTNNFVSSPPSGEGACSKLIYENYWARFAIYTGIFVKIRPPL